jgi:hypothetical protein
MRLLNIGRQVGSVLFLVVFVGFWNFQDFQNFQKLEQLKFFCLGLLPVSPQVLGYTGGRIPILTQVPLGYIGIHPPINLWVCIPPDTQVLGHNKGRKQKQLLGNNTHNLAPNAPYLEA